MIFYCELNENQICCHMDSSIGLLYSGGWCDEKYDSLMTTFPYLRLDAWFDTVQQLPFLLLISWLLISLLMQLAFDSSWIE